MEEAMNSVIPIWGRYVKEAFFRRKFTLEEKVSRGVVRIFADTGYELFLNERPVAIVDEWNNTRDYDVTPFLKAGENLVAVHGLNHSGHRGFSFELCCNGMPVLVSDGSWRAADREIWDWQRICFDDQFWPAAQELPLQHAGLPQWRGHAGDRPEKVIPYLAGSPFFPGAIPKAVRSPFYGKTKRKREEISPEILKVIGDEYRISRNATPKEQILPAAWPEVDGCAHGSDGVFRLTGTSRYEGPFFFVDFGEETVGHLRFRTESSSGPVRVRIRYGEMLAECVSEPARDQLLHRMLVEEIMLGSGVQEWESRMRVGFRFVRVELFDSPAEVEFSRFSVRSSLYPAEYRGYFHCSDPLLNRIWEAGRKTLHLCMQEYYLDGIKRDRFLWVGDARAEALYNYYLFGDQELFRFCWEELASVQYADGAIPSEMGEGASLLWDYVAWWVIAFHDYRLFTGDDVFPLQLRNNLYAAVDWLAARAGTDGKINLPENPYPSWMIVLNKAVGPSPFLNLLYLRSLQTALEIADLSGDSEAKSRYRSLLEQTEPTVQDLLRKHPLSEEDGLQSSSTGLYEILEHWFAQGNSRTALESIRKNWGNLLDSGADTLYEGFYAPDGKYPSVTDPKEKRRFISFCHGWTAGPCALLPAEIAGIKPLEPGFRRFRVAPRMEDLSEVKTVVPTPHGEIALAITSSELHLLVPQGTIAELELLSPIPLRKSLKAGSYRISLLSAENGMQDSSPQIH